MKPTPKKAAIVAMVMDFGAACEAQGRANVRRDRVAARKATEDTLIHIGKIMDALDELGVE